MTGTPLKPPFDPRDGVPLIGPPCGERGCWAGAPAVTYDERARLVYLSYRLRTPARRGYETRIAVSEDGLRFREVWRLEASALGSPSIERSALVLADGVVRLYVSYVDGADRRWRIDLLEARAVGELEVSRRVPALTAAATDVEGVKDPVIVRGPHGWLLFASCAVSAGPRGRGPFARSVAMLHSRGDAFATGAVRSATGLAASEDGVRWRWEGVVLAPDGRGWDAYETRLSCVLPANGGYLGLYDGIASVDENYEERTGLAFSRDLRSWEKTSLDGPALASASGSLRYVASISLEDRRVFYYEAARSDRAHELRVTEARELGGVMR